MKSVAFTHHKGGTGKTTACISVAGWLVRLGKRVLVVDLDPQGNATTGLGIDRDTVEDPIFDVLTGKANIKSSILETASGVHLLPSTHSLLKAEQYLAKQKSPTTMLRKKLRNIQKNYNYLCIDTPPSGTLLMLNGIAAAKNIIIPLDTSVFAVETMETLRSLFEMIDETIGTTPVIQQLLLLEYPHISFFRKSPTTEIEKALRELLQDYCDEIPPITRIPYSRLIYDSQKQGMPLSHTAPGSRVGKVFRKITEQFMKK